jgi:WD40 repeat protein
MGRTASGARTFLFDLRTRELANTFDAGGAMAFSPDGRRLVISGLESGSEPGVGYVVDTQVPGGAPLALTGSEAGDLGKPAWSPEGSMLATATGMGKVIVWDAGTGIRRFTIVPADGRFEAVAFSPDSRRLATASTAGTAIVWALSADGVTKMLTLTGNDLEAVALSFSPDGTRLMMGGVTTTRVWDVTP